jgi:hypothetical protein
MTKREQDFIASIFYNIASIFLLINRKQNIRSNFMGAKRNVQNQFFGKLYVLEEVPFEERPNPKKVFWKC